MAWLPLHDTFPDDQKTVALCLELRCDTADAYPPRLWLWALTKRADGKLLPGDVERACRWKGKRGRLEAAMKTVGFVDPDGALHNWMHWGGAEVSRIEEERKYERERKAAWRVSQDKRDIRRDNQPGSPGDNSRDNKRDIRRDSRPPARSRPRAPAESRAEQSRAEHEDKNTSGAGAPVDGSPDGGQAWRKSVPGAVQELIDTLRREVTKYSPEAVWSKPTKQEAISGARLVRLVREGKIPGADERQRERLLFVLHAAPASAFWRGKLFNLTQIEKHLNALLDLTRKDWDTWKDDPDPLAVFAQCR